MNDSLSDFFEKISNDVNKVEATNIDVDRFKNIPILNTQCVYIYDFPRNKITFCRNAHILGFSDQEFTIEDALNYHPDDRRIINAVTESSIKFGLGKNDILHGCCLQLTFRLKKKDGGYLQVLKQTTIFQLDEKSRMSTNVTILSDISFINTPGHINWSFKLKNLNSDSFENAICEEVRNIFTKKELEIIPLIIKGETSQSISNQLFISKHTVDTHRRNIKRKSGCDNIYELMSFATRNKLN